MRKGLYGVSHGTVSTYEIVQLILDLLDNKIDPHTAYDKLGQMNEKIHEELGLLSTLENGTPVTIEKPKEWYIHNEAKSMTRGAIIGSLMKYIKKSI